MSKAKPTTDKAIYAWVELATFNSRTYYLVNDLLENVCKTFGAPYYTISEDPIWYSIAGLTNAQRRFFIKKCAAIRNSITEEEWKMVNGKHN